jgi:hypothetical protein
MVNQYLMQIMSCLMRGSRVREISNYLWEFITDSNIYSLRIIY